MLNLFGYTGGFSVHAAAAGAASTDTVDLARPALEAARRNFARNDLPADRHRVHAGDAFAFLEQAAAEGRTLGHRDLRSAQLRPPQGRAGRRPRPPTAACTPWRRRWWPEAACSARPPAPATSTARPFLATVEEGSAPPGRRFSLETIRGAGFDHPVAPWFPEGDYLKFAIGTVDER